MHLTYGLLLILAFACASKNSLNHPSEEWYRTFKVESETEARELITSRLTYLRHLFKIPGLNTDCFNPNALGDIETDSEGNLYSISRIFLSGSGYTDCPGPGMKQGFLILLFCKSNNIVKETRFKKLWNDDHGVV